EPWFDELAEFLRIPSISADPLHASDVLKAADWVCALIRDAGGGCDVVDWNGQPLAIGEITASHGGDAPTVICYGHFDVQPPDPLELWESEPFEPEIRGEYLYGRGTVDDKGQLYMLLAAARELARAGELPVNVRFCCDGEEETGGNSIVEFLAADERGGDAAIIFDSGMIRRDVPAFDIATRGVIYFHVTLRTGERDLHSGVFGGAALNAAHALIETLQALIARDGTLVDSLRQGVVPPTDDERASWTELPTGADELAEQGARAKDPDAARDFYLRTFAEPAGADLEVERWSSASPGLVPPDAPAIQLGLDAFERAVGVRPLLVRTGGTLPIVPAFAETGIPVVITGFGLPDSQIHSPNERLRAEYVEQGIAAARELFRAFAAL